MIGPFTGEHAYLSNFCYAPFQFADFTFPTVEHFYQSSKASNAHDWATVYNAPTPREAKRLGRQVPMNTGFEAAKKVVMLNGVMAKFRQHPELAARLVATGTEPLCEVNTWGDTFWGQVNGIGENWLGRILMMAREVIS